MMTPSWTTANVVRGDDRLAICATAALTTAPRLSLQKASATRAHALALDADKIGLNAEIDQSDDCQQRRRRSDEHWPVPPRRSITQIQSSAATLNKSDAGMAEREAVVEDARIKRRLFRA